MSQSKKFAKEDDLYEMLTRAERLCSYSQICIKAFCSFLCITLPLFNVPTVTLQ